ncbi:MAG: N-6 DNA methylase, partial [Candidatus Methanoperedens sp.]|nr:N-6 DNA methylase [Candidatus Methanoperedens sp.]
MAQTTLNPIYYNRNLFSNYYLDNKVKTRSEWEKDYHIEAFSKIKKLYDEERESFENFNEAQLIKHFLDPIFKILLFESEVEEAAGSEFPDYAFFRDKTSRDEAHKNKGTISFYTNALAIGEVKKWDTELDGKPIHQLRNYLDVTEKKWGILTNGRKWRLFCKEKKRDEYYEVDLPSLLDTNNIEEFKYFFHFFRRDAFLSPPDNFLDIVLKGSADHAKAIGDNLKENVYKAMKIIADGFFGRPQNNLDKNDETARGLVQKNTMLLLYRLLFLLYAEDRNLLNIKNPKYKTNHSFYRIKNEVEEKRGRGELDYTRSSTSIWDRLKNLFELINIGSEALGEKEFHVPAYNGGLFDQTKNPGLETWKIGDHYLAEAIHLLTRSDVNGSGFVDYSDLEIRHLGSIYEGLLEYKLKVVDSDFVAKGNEWVALEKYNEGRKQKKTFEEFDEFNRARKGELYLATDKGERKATGSYYTPDYIVNYIVKNTIGPVVDEKRKGAPANNQSLIDATLSVKVLDPAMGSGHFLVGAVEFIAEELLKAAQKDIEAGRLVDEPRFSDPDWARREVVAHCIYGVDLNPMAVELAKVSLWLKTISKEKPLSFLDHRLKQGNSLIGAHLEKLHKYPDLKAKKEEKKVKDAAQQTFEVEIERPFFDKIVKILNSLTDINDDSIENINKKKDIFEKLIASPEYQRIKALANLHTAIYFGVVTTKVDKEPKHGYGDILWALRDNEEEWRKKTNREWFGKARRLAEEKSFFHWELEFPEIFFEGGAPKENPGWDAVVGNPPYDVLSAKERGEEEEKFQYELDYFKGQISGFSGKLNLYRLMSERSYSYLRDSGRFGFIIPNTVMADQSSAPLRKFL